RLGAELHGRAARVGRLGGGDVVARRLVLLRVHLRQPGAARGGEPPLVSAHLPVLSQGATRRDPVGLVAFRARYGPRALVAGGSEGLGAAFARALAARGLDLVLVARRREPPDALAATLRAAHGVDVRTLAVDLGAPDAADTIASACADVEIGLVVLAAAATRVAPFFAVPLADKLRAIDVNCRAPLMLAHHFGARMKARRRGGLVFLSSLAGLYGGPYVATYAATKAFDTILAESLAG